jgi:hypothetical protein
MTKLQRLQAWGLSLGAAGLLTFSFEAGVREGQKPAPDHPNVLVLCKDKYEPGRPPGAFRHCATDTLRLKNDADCDRAMAAAAFMFHAAAQIGAGTDDLRLICAPPENLRAEAPEGAKTRALEL